MRNRYILITIFVSLITFGGCASTPKANLTQFNQSNEALYPSISVVTTSEELQYSTHRQIFLQALKEANVFKSIDINNPYSDFAMEVYLETENKSVQNNAEAFAKGVIIGGTLGLVPIGVEFSSKGAVKLRFKGVVFDEFTFQSEYKGNVTIFNADSKDAGISGSYRKSVEAILEELQKRKSFEKLREMCNEQEKKVGL